MNFEDIVEARLAGEGPAVPEEMREDLERALRGFEAIQFSLGETILAGRAAPIDSRPPRLPADYRIVRELGRGGMGVVYLARQESLGRDVAVKVLRPGEAVYAPVVKRFLEEARHLAKVRHPNIVTVHEVGEADGEPYFTMDFVEGEPLSARIARGALTPAQAVGVLKQACEGVGHAHRQGVIHRDLKPGNILLDGGGRAYVTDFGLARDMSRGSDLTCSGEILGTPAYMSPEQAVGEAARIGEATDVHALGVVLYEMLTGVPPYGHDAPAKVLMRLLNEEPVAPRAIDRRIPRDLETICLKAMAKDPGARYAGVAALLEDLRRFESGEPVLARRPGVAGRALRFAGRHWKLLAAAAVAAALALAAGPLLFEKTAEELEREAEKAHARGDHEGAVRFFRAAFDRAKPAAQGSLLDRMARCADEIADPARALEARLVAASAGPRRSFGRHDAAIAMALVARLRTKTVGRSFENLHDGVRADARLAFDRLEIMLAGSSGSEGERVEARAALAELRRGLKLDPARPYTSPTREDLTALPAGSEARLRELVATENSVGWDRGKAAWELGRRLEAQGRLPAALESYRQGLDLMRRSFPALSGLADDATPHGHRLADGAACGFLRQAVATIRRLDPGGPDPAAGGIRLRLRGAAVPPEICLSLRVKIWDGKPYEGLAWTIHPFPGTVALDAAGAAEVRLLDGDYHLTVIQFGNSVSPSDLAELPSLLELESAQVPIPVSVTGRFVEVDVPARLLEQVRYASPEDGARLDFSGALLRWEAVPGAARYRISFSCRLGDRPAFATAGAETAGTSLRFEDADLDGFRKAGFEMKAGVTVTWRVEAFDAAGRIVGRTVRERTFILATGPGDR